MTKFTREQERSIALLYALSYWGQGTVCVWREWQGKPAVLKLDNQSSYREWNGCFSLYNHAGA